jgi:hypothetical protein
VQRLDLTVVEEGEKSESFSRESEQDRSPFLYARERQSLGNVPGERFRRGKHPQTKPRKKGWKNLHPFLKKSSA